MNSVLPVALAALVLTAARPAGKELSIPSLPPGDSLVVVCLGNSTTAPRKNLREAYPERLQYLLRSKGIPARVYNAGKGGSHAGTLADNAFHRIAHGSDRFRNDALSLKPDWLVVAFGINDSWQDKGRGTPPRIPLPRFRECLTAFVHSMDSIGGRTLILGPNPLGDRYERFRKTQLDKYRRAARHVAHRTGALWVDKHPAFQRTCRQTGRPLDSLLLDGMHPNDEGHAIVASILSRSILKHQGSHP
ncbi:MAG: lipolytic protein G-D-S-L family [Chitinophagia bacterium]|nr:lipolytic protein G-D-S-L family [Chitinophagia bacterium]